MQRVRFSSINVHQNVLYLQTGDEKGTTPRLATVKASAMVARGAESALPTMVFRSSVIPKVDRSSIAERTKEGSPCKASLLANIEVGNFIMERDVSLDDDFGESRINDGLGNACLLST